MENIEGRFIKYMKFDENELYKRYQFYIPFFEGKKSILDIGCGSGHLLELLSNQGKQVLGVDSDEEMIRNAKQKNVPVIKQDVFTFLENEANSYDGIFCSNLVEHLSTIDVIRILNHCHRILSSGGIIILVVPNPSCIFTQLNEFWRDPTHVRMYNKELIEFLLYSAGFNIVASGENQSYKLLPEINKENESNVESGNKGASQRSRFFLSIILSKVARYILKEDLSILNEKVNNINYRIDIIYRLLGNFNFPEVFTVGKKPQ